MDTASPDHPDTVIPPTAVAVSDNVTSTSKASDNKNVWDGFTLVSSIRKRKTPRNMPSPRKEKKVVLESEALDTDSDLTDQILMSN